MTARPTRTLVSATLALLGISCASGPGSIVSVTVHDAQFAQVRTLSGDELDRFNAMWAARREVGGSPQEAGGAHYKIDLGNGRRSLRYLYYTSGRLTLLAHDLQPVYAVPDVEAFNRLIGAAEEGAPQGAS